MARRSELKRLRKLAGLLTESHLNEEMAQAWREKGRWTDGTYTEGDSITWRGLGWNLEWEPDPQGLANNGDTGQPVEGAWFIVNDIGEEREFEPGMEDRHDPQFNAKPVFPESRTVAVNEASELAVSENFDKLRDMVERWEKITKPGGFLERQISGIGGDPAGLNEVRRALEDLYRALDEADYHARAHLSQE